MYFYQIKCCFVIRIYSATGRRYVMKKVDELTKNRREMDSENISGHMPEDREMPEYCPVRNFETYLQKLHPQCNRLWQFPKDSFNISDECWFQKRPIGKDTLASFMFTLSKKKTFHKSTPTTPFVQRVQLSSEETVQWHKLWQLPDTNLPRQLQYINVFHQRKNKLWQTLSQVMFVESNHLNYPQ